MIYQNCQGIIPGTPCLLRWRTFSKYPKLLACTMSPQIGGATHCCTAAAHAPLPNCPPPLLLGGGAWWPPAPWLSGSSACRLHNPSQIDECKSQPRLHNVAANRGAIPCFENSCRLAWQGAKNHENDAPNFFPAAGAAESPWKGGALGGARGGFLFFFKSEHFRPLGTRDFLRQIFPQACLRKFRPHEKPLILLVFSSSGKFA